MKAFDWLLEEGILNNESIRFKNNEVRTNFFKLPWEFLNLMFNAGFKKTLLRILEWKEKHGTKVTGKWKENLFTIRNKFCRNINERIWK